MDGSFIVDEKTLAIRAMRELLSDPKRWTQGYDARNVNGGRVCARDPDAVSWCLVGAAYKVTTPAKAEEVCWMLDGLTYNVMGWNDHPGRTHQQVLALLDGMIASC